MKIKNDITNQVNNIDTSDIRINLDKIKVFEIYDRFSQIHVPGESKIPVLNAMAKKQNANAWFLRTCL